ncbi:LytTR family DNA-binding domain-containing protein [Caulobacter sp. 17J65-9]|uniref:response regulator n=1 Tax=Caulobacter sp. 17J65-9 TaxID=2709382 RepID=UPI001969F51B
MTLKVLLVDDEPLALERLALALRDVPDTQVVGTAADGEAAADAIARLRPDLVLLDIQMPGADGLSLAAALPTEDRPEIVFVTAFNQHAPDAFELEATDYLLKPVQFDRLRQAVERARRRRSTSAAAARAAELEALVRAMDPEPAAAAAGCYDNEIWVPSSKGLIRVDLERVTWIEAAGDYVLFHSDTRSHIHRITMGALAGRLDPARIARVHRSAFVRLGAVASVERLGKGLIALTLTDGGTVQVGPSYTKCVLAALGARQTRDLAVAV